MEQDVKNGRTAYNLLKSEQSLQNLPKEKKLNLLLNPSLPPLRTVGNSLLTVQVSHSHVFGDILAVKTASRVQKSEQVNRAARSIAAALKDSHSLNKWRKTLWQLVRAQNGSKDIVCASDRCIYSYFAYKVQKGVVAGGENVVKRPGAFVTSELNKLSWWGEVKQASNAVIQRE